MTKTINLRQTKWTAKQGDLIIALGVVSDGVVVIFALTAAFWVRFRSGLIPFFGIEDPHPLFIDYLPLFTVGTTFLLLAFAYLGLYDREGILRYRRVADIILRGTVFWLVAYLGLSLALKFEPPISRVYVLLSFCCSVIGLIAWRRVMHVILHLESVAPVFRQRVLFVGWMADADRILSAIVSDPSNPYDPIGCVASPLGQFRLTPPASLPQIGSFAELSGILARREVDIVVLTEAEIESETLVALANECEREYARFKMIASYHQFLASSLHLETISGVPVLGVLDPPLNRTINRVAKRTVDIVGAITGLLLSAPLIAFCGALVYFESPGPMLFRQRRTGRNGQLFEILKIRSMRLDAEVGGAQWAQKNDPRRLKIGAFMREWNIDETPQFWNVLKGEMSLVGPRPERPELIENFKHQVPHYNARHASKPGITGWAQVNGLRGNTSLEERVRYDLYYLENWTLWLDLQIMFMTFFHRENAY